MPIFDYLCPDCDKMSPDRHVTNPAPNRLPCDCGSTMRRLIGIPAFQLNLAELDDAKDIYEGFEGFDGFDGINESTYKSTKAFF